MEKIPKKIFFTVGPSQLFPNVSSYIKSAMDNGICSINHRGREFAEIFEYTASSLKKLLNVPQESHIFFLGSATEAMERIIENCVEKHSYHFINGAFSAKFFNIAKELKKSPEKIEAALGDGFSLFEINSKIKIPQNAELICFTQNETSTGTAIGMEGIYRIKRANPEKLIAIDVVSSLPYVNIDYSLIDCTFFSVQKGFGMPPGLGVLILNEEMLNKSNYLKDRGCDIGTYHSFPSLLKSAEKSQTPETPNILAIHILGKVCDDMLRIGLKKIRKETEEKAKLFYDFFDANNELKPLVQSPHWRSKTTLVMKTPNGSKQIINKLMENGFVVSSGYGEFKDAHIRIANFPAHKAEDVERLVMVF